MTSLQFLENPYSILTAIRQKSGKDTCRQAEPEPIFNFFCTISCSWRVSLFLVSLQIDLMPKSRMALTSLLHVQFLFSNIYWWLFSVIHIHNVCCCRTLPTKFLILPFFNFPLVSDRSSFWCTITLLHQRSTMQFACLLLHMFGWLVLETSLTITSEKILALLDLLR